METQTTTLQPSEENLAMGTLVGLAVGDALGAQVEFWSRQNVRSRYPDGLREMRASGVWELGEYTDDTDMALLLADSLLDRGCLDPLDVAARFKDWARNAKDVGTQIRRVTGMKAYLVDPERCAADDYASHPNNAAGNGAVMRCAPVAIFHASNQPMLVADSKRSALLTHGDPKAQSSCVLINAAIAYFLNGGKDPTAPWEHGMAVLTAPEKAAWSRLDGIASLSEDAISSSGYTVASVEAAFWCFANTESYESATELAASLGGDADTVAAITGALAGAYYGFGAIPDRWAKHLKDLERICSTAVRLAGSNT